MIFLLELFVEEYKGRDLLPPFLIIPNELFGKENSFPMSKPKR
jgi:hypothetical protein